MENTPTEFPDIRFEPLTEGLGFHPFSDGMPYAPIAKNPRLNSTRGSGTGATAARPPRPVSPPMTVPQIKVPVVSPRKEPERKSVPLAPPAVVAPPILHYGAGYVMRRILAAVGDTLVSAAVGAVGISLILWQKEADPALFLNSNVLLITCVALSIFHWGFVLLQEVLFLKSIGKWVVHLQFPQKRLQILIRGILFLPSLGMMGLGLFWAVLDERKRCWHDVLSLVQPEDAASQLE